MKRLLSYFDEESQSFKQRVEDFPDDEAAEIASLPPPVLTISAIQARVTLRRHGLLDQAKSVVSAAGGEAEDWFEYATVWHSNNPQVLQLGGLLGLDEAAIRELFVEAGGV